MKSNKEYNYKFNSIKTLLNEFDPCGLIHTGAPSNEYDCLTEKILSHIINKKSKSELINMINNEIKNHFGAPTKPLNDNIKSQYNTEMDGFINQLLKINGV
jgi:hypothetical protein